MIKSLGALTVEIVDSVMQGNGEVPQILKEWASEIINSAASVAFNEIGPERLNELVRNKILDIKKQIQ